MSTILTNIIYLLIAAIIAFSPILLCIETITLKTENYVFKLRDGALVIDERTFLMSPVRRFLVRHFPKAVIILKSGKELYFYKGIRNKSFVYDGKFSLMDSIEYDEIEEYIK